MNYEFLVLVLLLFSPIYTPELPQWSQVPSSDEIQEEMLTEGMEQGILGNYQKAVEIFSEVIRLYPLSAEAYYNRGIAYTYLESYPEAIADYAQALTLNPDFAEVYVARAQLFSLLGERQKAIADLQTALNLFQRQGNIIAYENTLRLLEQIQPQPLIKNPPKQRD